MAASDLTKTGPALIFAMINTANSATLTRGVASATNMTFGVPAVLAGGDASGKNTSLAVTAVAGQGYTSPPSVTITYNRLNIDTDVLAKLAPSGVSFVDAAYAKVSDLLAIVNSTYSLNLQAGDISNGNDALSGAYPRTATLTIAAGSLVYIGSAAITITQADVALSSAIATTNMDGLTGPA